MQQLKRPCRYWAIALVIVCAACGSRQSEEELLKKADRAAAGSGSAVEVGAGDSVGEPGVVQAAPVSGVGTGAGDGKVSPAGGSSVVTSAGGGPGGSGRSGGVSAGKAAAVTGLGGGGAAASPESPRLSSGSGGGATEVGSGGGPPVPEPSGGGEVKCSRPEPTITIGAVGEQTGPAGRFLADAPRAVSAWVAWVNARGGLHCHPLRYIVADDGGDPARNQALTRKMVEEDRAVAFVANFAPIAGHASVRYLEEKRIPAVGSEGGSRWFYESPMYFPQMSSGDGVPAYNFGAMADFARPLGLKKVASMGCIEVQSCGAFYDNAPKLAERFGLELVYRARASLVQPDFTSHCQAAKTAGAEMLIIGLDGNSVARIAKSCQAVNYKPVLSLPMSAGDNEMLKNPQLDGLVVAMPLVPFIVTDNPGIAEYRQVLGKFAPGLPISAATISGWSAAKLFQEVTTKKSNLSSQDILEGAWSIKGNDLGGLTYPLTFTKDQKAPQVLCYWHMQIKNGQFTLPNGSQRTCPPGWTTFQG